MNEGAGERTGIMWSHAASVPGPSAAGGRTSGPSTLFAAMVMMVLTAASAASQSVSYDPESCATDTGGRVFVRLMNGQSFAFPAGDLVSLRGRPGWPDEEFADLNEPVGCPLHPITSQSLVVRYHPVAPRDPAEPDGRWRPELLQVITNPDAGGPHLNQESILERFGKICVLRSIPDRYEDHLVAVSSVMEECRIAQRDKPDDGDWPSDLVARPGTHPEYGGRRFAVSCRHPQSPGASRTCEARYRMQGDLGIMYRFEDALVPPEHMAAFDLQIRAFIEANRTPGLDVPDAR